MMIMKKKLIMMKIKKFHYKCYLILKLNKKIIIKNDILIIYKYKKINERS